MRVNLEVIKVRTPAADKESTKAKEEATIVASIRTDAEGKLRA